MGQEAFESSDSQRSAKPLRHARTHALSAPLDLELGGQLVDAHVAYEVYGVLNTERSNAILVCHALTGDSHVARHSEQDDPGWWDIMVGPGRPIDTDTCFVICVNVIGGCRGSTGPESPHPSTGEAYAADFPTITVSDIVESQRDLIDHLGISKLKAVVGGSLGGHQALTWAARYPDRIDAVIALATSTRLTAQAIAFDVVGRNAILRDPNFAGGRYYDEPHAPEVGLAIARMLGHITYLSQDAMTAKFQAGSIPPVGNPSEFERKFSVGSYLAHQGEQFVSRFDANSYMTLSMAMDLVDLGVDQAALQASLGTGSCRWLIVSFSSDWLFPPFQSREIVEALIPLEREVTYCNIDTPAGHDAFLLEDALDNYGSLVRGFITPATDTPAAGHERAATDLLGSERLDYQYIDGLIHEGASVLDLGCGSGELLERLRDHGHDPVMGVENHERAIVDCTRRGLPVIHADIDQGLGVFADDQFDVVVLSQTLQAVNDVEQVLREMLRVASHAIVSFPNAAHHAQRTRLSEEGLAPNSALDDRHQWSDPPALRVFSIRDFERFCEEHGLRVQQFVALDTDTRSRVEEDANLNAHLAIFVLSR
jgi:homoserine O-acetyltransferase